MLVCKILKMFCNLLAQLGLASAFNCKRNLYFKFQIVSTFGKYYMTRKLSFAITMLQPFYTCYVLFVYVLYAHFFSTNNPFRSFFKIFFVIGFSINHCTDHDLSYGFEKNYSVYHFGVFRNENKFYQFNKTWLSISRGKQILYVGQWTTKRYKFVRYDSIKYV